MSFVLRSFVAGAAILAITPVCALAGERSASDWQGLYLGVHGGYARSNFTNYDSGLFNPDSCWNCNNDYGSSISGFIGGGTIGYNQVTGNYLLGIEGEIGFGNVNGSANDPTNIDPETNVRVKSYGTVAGRAGYVAGDLLVYGKVGLGVVNTNLNWVDPYYEADASGRATMSGAVVGGGIEYAVKPNMSVKLEYVRFLLDETNTLDVQNYDGGYEQIVGIGNINTVKIGLNFTF